VGDPSSAQISRPTALTSRQTQPTHLAPGTATQRRKSRGPVTTHGALLEVHARDVSVVCIADLGLLFSPQHPPTDIRAPFHTHDDDCTRLFSFFLFVLFSSISPNTYGLLLSWLVHLLRSTAFHLDWTFFGGRRLRSKRIWIWIWIWIYGPGYGFGWMEGVTFDGFDWTTRRLGLLFEVVLCWDMFGFDSWFNSSTAELVGWSISGYVGLPYGI
jgi:hypothetical protein